MFESALYLSVYASIVAVGTVLQYLASKNPRLYYTLTKNVIILLAENRC